jgi:hypothetical protein
VRAPALAIASYLGNGEPRSSGGFSLQRSGIYGGGGIRTLGVACATQRFSRPPRSTAPAPRRGRSLSPTLARPAPGRQRHVAQRATSGDCPPTRPNVPVHARRCDVSAPWPDIQDRPVRPLWHPAVELIVAEAAASRVLRIQVTDCLEVRHVRRRGADDPKAGSKAVLVLVTDCY